MLTPDLVVLLLIQLAANIPRKAALRSPHTTGEIQMKFLPPGLWLGQATASYDHLGSKLVNEKFSLTLLSVLLLFPINEIFKKRK